MNVMQLNSELIFGGGLERIIVDLITTNKGSKNFLCVINDKWSSEHLRNIDENITLLCNRKEGTRNTIINFLFFSIRNNKNIK